MPITIGSNLIQSDLPAQNVYPNVISPENVILQQPSIVKLNDENNRPKSSDWNGM